MSRRAVISGMLCAGAAPLLVLVLVLVLVPVLARPAHAQASSVPAELQVDLLSKLVGYDRNFPARAGEVARVLVLVKAGNPKSGLSAAVIRAALSNLGRLGKLPVKHETVTYEGGAALAKRCTAERIAIVYVTPGFDSDVADLREALSGVDVLSVGAVAEYVPEGIVLGFELQSGKPKILLNHTQARRQKVDFAASVLKLMKVFR